MNITLVVQWFPPEQAPIGYMIKELAEALASEGHEVTIITGFPNHPAGVVFGGYRKRLILQERLGNVNVTRVWLATSANRSRLNRIFTFLTFTLTSALALLMQSKPQIIFAVFQPLSVGVTLPLLARIKGAKLILNVQDLHPDAQIELGMIKNPLIIKALRAVERFGYQRANALAVICENFKEHCIARGAKAENVQVIPNWIDLNEIKPCDRNNTFRQNLGLSDQHFVILYAGTVGWVSGAGVMLEVALLLRDLRDVRIVFVGEGPLVTELKEEAKTLGLDNVVFAPFQPREILSQVQAMSDVSVVSLRAGMGRASVPSKVLGYMAAARPVLASVDTESETARTILLAHCGWVIEPENSEKLAEAIRSMQGDAALRRRLGESGRKFMLDNYAQQTVTDKYIEFFKQTILK
jgi:colanic acid biosynthesis glycosyl transferase WcaI